LTELTADDTGNSMSLMYDGSSPWTLYGKERRNPSDITENMLFVSSVACFQRAGNGKQ